MLDMYDTFHEGSWKLISNLLTIFSGFHLIYFFRIFLQTFCATYPTFPYRSYHEPNHFLSKILKNVYEE